MFLFGLLCFLPFSLHCSNPIQSLTLTSLPASAKTDPSMSSQPPPAISDPSSRHFTYSRKQKSLGLLCTNFLNLYDRDDVHLVGLDDAAFRLGVERRRIYDIVNVLESIGVLARKAKNQYTWKGFAALPAALQELKDEGLRENPYGFDGANDSAKVSDDEDDEESLSNPSTGSQNDKSNTGSSLVKSSKTENKREKSLALLTQNFVKLFICSNIEMVSLDEAAKLLLGNAHNSSIMRTKVRRLYDIANVLSSMNLIEKTHTRETRKPAFRWLGVKEKTWTESTDSVHKSALSNESRKRMFGDDVTNISFKRNKVDLFMDRGSSKKSGMQENDSCQAHSDKSNQKQEAKQDSRNYQFGPFAPAFMPKVGGAPESSSTAKQVHDWESLSTAHRPQYQNQDLKNMFSHYTEAWKSWYSEAAAKRHVKIL